MLFVCSAFLCGSAHAADMSVLTPEAAQALADHPGPVILYSLEPTIRPAPRHRSLDHFTILGKASLDAAQAEEAIAAFRAAMNAGDDQVLVAACFEPRHAISIRFNGHQFDYLLCYTCGSLEVFRDGKLVSDILASGSPSALNALLKAKGLRLSTSA